MHSETIRSMPVWLSCLGLSFSVMSFAQSEKPQDNQTPHSFKKEIRKTVEARYLVSLPEGYEKERSKRWPLMLFLHGSGERGNDLERVKANGPPHVIAQGKKLPFIVVSPQCPENQSWSVDTLNALLDVVIKDYRVDEDRVYLTGLSMGGFGTWALAAAHPERFAAIAPVCGGGDVRTAGALKSLPIWAFHGEKDDIVLPKESQRMVDAVNKAGGSAKLTLYPDANHNSWTVTYDNPELYEWLLSHKRQKPAEKP